MDLVRTDLGVAIDSPSGLLPVGQILAIGRNYAEHAKEQAAAVPTRPMLFVKAPTSACLSGDAIVIPPICRDPQFGGEQVDFEAELAVVIGTRGKDIPEADALSHVRGYCCANDVSARWWQKEGSGGQFCRGKSFDTFCPLGPRVTPAAEVPDPQALRVRCRVNGSTMQDDTTAGMIFPVAYLIAELSKGTTLLPGTVILTGTPGGVGMARKPPVWLRDGDTVEVEIDGLGVLRNPVRNG
jgi:2-keto-4-pentenoate hydratase/2-oxohepta-3-ene-1,7-dioic acid hydratase in catechol pathway